MENLSYLKLLGAVLGEECIEGVVTGWLNQLTPRSRQILEFRFGLKDGQCRTLEEVGKEFGASRERSRQIEAKALRHIRLIIGFGGWVHKVFT